MSPPRVVAGLCPDQFEPGEPRAYLLEYQLSPVAVLNSGGVDDDRHREPFAVNQCVDLTTLDLLAGVVTHLGILTAPFQLI